MSSTTNILVIEDDRDDFLLLKGIAKKIESFPIKLEYNAEGWDISGLMARQFDLWLVDYRLGVKTGLEIVTRAREMGFDRPIIVMTGVADEALAAKALRIGADDYLIKDQITPYGLERAIRYSVERRNAQQDLVAMRAQKQAAEEGQRYEERFRKMIDYLTEYAVFLLDRDGTIASWNLGAERMFDYPEEQVLGLHYRELFDDRNENELNLLELRDVEENESVSKTLEACRRDGSKFWANCVTNWYLDPVTKREGLVMVIQDVSEQLEAERSLMESEEFNRSIFESSPDRISVMNRQGSIIRMNKSGLLLSGMRDIHEVEGMIWLDLWDDVYRERAQQAIKVALGGEQGRFQGMSRRKDRNIWWDVIVSPIMGVHNEVIRLVSVSRDVTGRKQLEEQKDEFLGVASHELKTPVTSIKAYAQIMERRFEKQGDLQSLELMRKLSNQLTKLTGLINDLLDVTKIEGGRLAMRREKVSVNDLLQSVVDVMQFDSEKHVLRLDLDDPVWVLGDEDRLEQVLVNLISNAIKYSPAGGYVDISTNIRGSDVIVAIQDYGVGIPEDQLGKIFERFYRVDSGEKDAFAGLGLGLYICYDIVNRHNGRIWVESEEHRGTTFFVQLAILADRLGEKEGSYSI